MNKTPITPNNEADPIYMNDDGEAATVARPRFSGQNISLQSDLNGICILVWLCRWPDRGKDKEEEKQAEKK